MRRPPRRLADLTGIYISEIFDPKTKQVGVGSAVALTWLLNYGLAKATPLALANPGFGVGYGWCVRRSADSLTTAGGSCVLNALDVLAHR